MGDLILQMIVFERIMGFFFFWYVSIANYVTCIQFLNFIKIVSTL